VSTKPAPDLFPWILGGVAIAVAIPVVMALTESMEGQPPAATSSPVQPVDPAPGEIHRAPASASAPAPARVGVVDFPIQPRQQIWQCVIDGQKTFSDSPCGPGASFMHLNAVNRMDPEPDLPVVSYQPYMAAEPVASLPDVDVPDEIESPATRYIVLAERERRERGRRAHNMEHRHRAARD
jgi:hypothetical protein